MSTTWTVRLARAAEDDFQRIVEWTIERFGRRQAQAYAVTMSLALRALRDGPETIDARPRPEVGRGIFVLHVARERQKGRHFIVSRARRRSAVVEVLRILHDSMEIPGT